MGVSASVAAAFHSPLRTAGECFSIEHDADIYLTSLKAEGRKNPRKSRWLDYRRADGSPVYRWTVRCNA